MAAFRTIRSILDNVMFLEPVNSAQGAVVVVVMAAAALADTNYRRGEVTI